MYRLEKTVMREERCRHKRNNPSFSSTLLDQIYRSIDDDDDGETKLKGSKVYMETMQKKQSNGNVKSNRSKGPGEEEKMWDFQRTYLFEKWMEKKVGEKANAEKRQVSSEFERKSHHEHEHDHDQDVLFFSSSSSSSDSSSGGFSSSDTESMYGTKTKAPCFVHPRPEPVRTSVSARPEKPLKKTEKTGRTEKTLFHEQRELHMFDDYHYNSASDRTKKLEESVFKSKSRAMRIYGNLKKVKQPISPGGRLASFINSLFTTGNTKKAKSSSSSILSCDDDERQLKSGEVSTTCSSASSFSRSCLSKNSPSTRERLRNGVKRTVRFCPVSVILDEDSRPCGQKCLYEEGQDSSLLSVSVPTAWKIGRSPSRRCEEELKFQTKEKTRRVEEMAREFMKEYHLNQKNNFISRETRSNYVVDEMDEDEDDDAASYSSSDLFELDHLVLMSNDRYREELPVYETTHVETNRAIANGLIQCS